MPEKPDVSVLENTKRPETTASETFLGTRGMLLSGRFQSSLAMETIKER